MPAEAGTQGNLHDACVCPWIPACAGMTIGAEQDVGGAELDPRVRDCVVVVLPQFCPEDYARLSVTEFRIDSSNFDAIQ